MTIDDAMLDPGAPATLPAYFNGYTHIIRAPRSHPGKFLKEVLARRPLAVEAPAPRARTRRQAAE